MFSIILLIIFLVILALKVRSLRRSSTLLRKRSGINKRPGSGDGSGSSTDRGTGLRAGSGGSGKQGAKSSLVGNLLLQPALTDDTQTLLEVHKKINALQQKLGNVSTEEPGGQEDTSDVNPQPSNREDEENEEDEDFSDVLADIQQTQSDRITGSQEPGTGVRSFSSGYGYNKALSRKLRI